MTTTTTSASLPRWLKPVNRVIVLLQRMGLAFFTFHLLSVAGRRSGRMRTTPVSPFAVDGRRYVLSLGQTEWVRNARAAGEGVLSRGRRRRRVALVEIHGAERARIAREFPRQVPHGAQMFAQMGVVAAPAGPDELAAAADRLTLFRLDDVALREGVER
jgi:deazaflavin-dependent oxidoreductase (nitroreductase family)